MLCAIARYLRQPITALIPQERAGPLAAFPASQDPALDTILQTLRARPDFIPLVEGSLETMLADTQQPAF